MIRFGTEDRVCRPPSPPPFPKWGSHSTACLRASLSRECQGNRAQRARRTPCGSAHNIRRTLSEPCQPGFPGLLGRVFPGWDQSLECVALARRSPKGTGGGATHQDGCSVGQCRTPGTPCGGEPTAPSLAHAGRGEIRPNPGSSLGAENRNVKERAGRNGGFRHRDDRGYAPRQLRIRGMIRFAESQSRHFLEKSPQLREPVNAPSTRRPVIGRLSGLCAVRRWRGAPHKCALGAPRQRRMAGPKGGSPSAPRPQT